MLRLDDCMSGNGKSMTFVITESKESCYTYIQIGDENS